jgi:hypothetical protein
VVTIGRGHMRILSKKVGAICSMKPPTFTGLLKMPT